MALRAVFLDVGETLVDETRAWGAVADACRVPRLAFFGVIGGLIERGEPFGRVFEIFGVEPPGWVGYAPDDLYPDAVPCLVELRRRGLRLGIVGNQPEACETFLADAGLEVDCVGSSERWGVAKPSAAFFERVVEEAGCEPGEVAYVGDRVDNDVDPALAAGLVAVHVRRGPWGHLQRGAERAHVRVGSLAELPEALAGV